MASVLVVEDSPTQAAEIAYVLEDAGFETTVVETGLAALSALYGAAYDVLVLDVILPEMSGFELCRRVRSTTAPETPVLLLTTLDDPGDIRRGAECGADSYMNKPWEPDDLVHLVSSLADENRAQPSTADGCPRATRYLQSILDHYSRRATARAGESHRALQRSEEMFALASIGANDGLWDWNLHTDSFRTNPRWKEIVGLRADAPDHPRQWLDHVHPDDHERIEAELHAHLAGDLERFENQHRILLPDGASRWVLVRGRSVRNGSGEAVRMAGSLTDIGEQKAIEARLLQATGELNDFLSVIPNLLLHLDPNGIVLSRRGGAEILRKLPVTTGNSIDDGMAPEAARRWRANVRFAVRCRKTAAFSFDVPSAGQPDRYTVRIVPIVDGTLAAVVSPAIEQPLAPACAVCSPNKSPQN